MSGTLPTLAPNDLQFGTHDLRDCAIESQRVEIGAGNVADRLLNCRFVNCELRIKCSGRMTGVIISKCTFDRCLVWPSVIQKVPNLDADFHSCRFKGRYEVGFRGIVENCCFSEAKLNHALFFTPTALDPCKLPDWPHVRIEDLANNTKDFMAAVPKCSLLWIMARKGPLSMVVNIEKASSSPEETWELLRNKSYVFTTREKASQIDGQLDGKN